MAVGDQGSSPSEASTQRSWVMFFSRLGPATAAHSACRESKDAVGPTTQPESPGVSPLVTKNSPFPPKSTQTLLCPSPSAPTGPSYLEELAVIWILRVGLPEETQPVLPGDKLSPWARGCFWMQPLTWG